MVLSSMSNICGAMFYKSYLGADVFTPQFSNFFQEP